MAVCSARPAILSHVSLQGVCDFWRAVRQVNCRLPVTIGVDFSSSGEQHVNHASASMHGGSHQCCVAILSSGIHNCICIQECLHHWFLSRTGRPSEGSQVCFYRLFWACLGC